MPMPQILDLAPLKRSPSIPGSGLYDKRLAIEAIHSLKCINKAWLFDVPLNSKTSILLGLIISP